MSLITRLCGQGSAFLLALQTVVCKTVAFVPMQRLFCPVQTLQRFGKEDMQAVPLKWMPWLYFNMPLLTSTFHTILILGHAWENEDIWFRAWPARPTPAAGAQTGALCLEGAVSRHGAQSPGQYIALSRQGPWPHIQYLATLIYLSV